MTEKAVVLARGLGRRMQQARDDVALDSEQAKLAERGHKALMLLGSRPFLDYVVDSLMRAGLRRICLVIAPDADAMRERARRVQVAAGVEVHCAVQQEPLGTADAVLAAEDFVGGDAFVLANGDDLYPDQALAALAARDDGDCWVAAFSRDDLVRRGNIATERIRDFAVITASEGGELLGIVEKPADPDRYMRDGRLWVNMNLYRFTPGIFESCRRIRPNPERGELELTAAVEDMLEREPAGFRVMFCQGGVLDLTTRADVLVVEKALGVRRLCF